MSKSTSQSKTFWNKEYSDPKHLTMSAEAASDLLTFEKWVSRNAEWFPFPKDGFVVDVGCGNGRNIIPLCGEYGMKGLGIDISGTATEQAKKVLAHAAKDSTDEEGNLIKGKNIEIEFRTQSISEPLGLEDQSVDVVLDMMTSHYLRKAERETYVQEVARVMKPYGWLFFKTFIVEGDLHIKRLIQEHPDRGEVITDEKGNIIGNLPAEENSYIHPKIGVYEHVFEEQEIYDLYAPFFVIHKMLKSYKHIDKNGKAFKRRTVSAYMERKRE
ncbi:MAG: class I SAM-dependent methyltransferase [Candidatus Pacebacteria bacterium]|nr:class I SAM-dependent methyltransferase [Candidatus Paceibacterota bacterium]